MIRLRQVALVANDLDAVVDELCESFGLEVCFNDPGVAAFGLHNALLVVGDQFLEVVSPTQDGTTAGRLLQKRSGDGGYMAIFEVDDLDERVADLGQRDVRIVWAGDVANIRGRHLHPRDVGGTLVSIDEPVPTGSWHWAGPSWAPRHGPGVSSIAGVTIGAADPEAMRARWRSLDLDHSVHFVDADDRGDGLDGVDLVSVDRGRVGESSVIGGVAFRLV